jgi:hypothetical protein
VAGDFSAAITWGDGQVSAGTIIADPMQAGTFDVRCTNTYAEEGMYALDVVIHDTGGASAEMQGQLSVSDAALQATGITGTAMVGVPFTAGVATLIDTNPSAAADDFSVTIAWGDGHTSPGTVVAVAGAPGQFTLAGTSTYAQPGSYDVTVTITDRGGSQQTSHTTWQVASAPPASLTATGATFHVARGKNVLLPIATFQDSDRSRTSGDFTAQVIWGDQHVSAGVVVSDPTTPGQFLVMAGNTYALDGNYPVQVTIHDRGGPMAVAQSTVIVGLGGPVGTPGTPVAKGLPPSSPVASPRAAPPMLTMHDGILKVVAAPGEIVRVEFRVLRRLADFHNELGLILLDAHGRVHGLDPTRPGFLEHALTSSHHRTLFRPNDGPGSRRILTLHGGDQLLFYLVQNTTTEAVLRANPRDLLAQQPLAFLSTPAGNPDGQSHARVRRQGRNAFVLSWEDLQMPASDRDFNDAVLAIGLLRSPAPRAGRLISP